MPALPNVPEVVKYRATWTAEGDTLAQTLHYFRYTGGPPSAGNLSTMAAAAVSAADTRFASLTTASSGMDSIEITDLTSPTSAQGSGGTPWSGTSAGSPLAPGTAALVNHTIGRRYRGGKPRTYLPVGIPADILPTGVWTPTFVAALSAAWGGWVADILASGAGCALTGIVNVSYFSGFTVVTNPVTGRARNVPKLRTTPIVDAIVAHTVPQTIASQRRRNRNA